MGNQLTRLQHRPLRCESLENRLLLSVTLTDYEQLMLYYINRARVDPAAEAARLGVGLNDNLPAGTISADPKQPLVPNQDLTDAAIDHSLDMLRRDFFDHTNPEGETVVDRAKAQGYPTSYVGENIGWEGSTGALDRSTQPARRYEWLFRSAPHRKNYLFDSYQDIGLGMRFGDFTDAGVTYDAAMVTQVFGRRNADTHLVGVVFDDANGNGTFDLHEGIANATVQIDDQSVTTSKAGGWSLQVEPGTRRIVVSGSTFGEPATSFVTVDSQNVQVDFLSGRSNGIVNFDMEASPEISDLGEVDYRHIEDLDVPDGDLWFEFESVRLGTLTVEAWGASESVLALYDQTFDVIASSSESSATPRIDATVDEGESFFLSLSGAGKNVDLRIANLVTTTGKEIQVAGTSGADHFEFSPTGSFLVTINGVEYAFDAKEHETIVFTGGAGDDTATLNGGPGAEVARFFPDHGTFGENGFLVTVNDVVGIAAHGGGGEDSAFMYDSPGDDEFVSRKGYGKLFGDGFVLETFDFMYNYGYATTADGSVDVAYMEDTPTADKFKFDWPKPGQFFGKMYGGGIYYNRAKNFETIEAVMTDGKNQVRLFDSEGDDTFYGQVEQSRVVGDGFDVTVTGYDSLIAYASKGTDIAHLVDSDEDDTIRARPHKVSLWGGDDSDPTYEITARRFGEFHFEAKHAGFDRAKLHDTALNDHVDASGNTASFYKTDGELEMLYEVVGFEWVKLYSTPGSGQDTVQKGEPLDFDLVYDTELWEDLP
jgi:cysteine-rich secretory family protein